MGSGTTVRVARRMKRNGIGIEILPEYFQLAQKDIMAIANSQLTQPALLEKKGKYETTKSKRRS
jgi:site-specific DNA-methyltransferase (adenine-specific)/site-specific DNA-methyltransferase (cytosine-N4-specific)